MVVVVYDSNNSGGYWWLSELQWKALEAAGWNVHWVQKNEKWGSWGRPSITYSKPLTKVERHPDGDFLGAVAYSAAKEFDRPEDSIEEFESITGLDASALGCSCCGPPHSFEYTDKEGKRHYASPAVVETEIRFS